MTTILLTAITAFLFGCSASSEQNMRKGCNLAMLNRAELDFFMASNHLDQARQTAGADTAKLAQLRQEYLAARRKYEFWQEDVTKRGHRGTIPEYKDANKLGGR